MRQLPEQFRKNGLDYKLVMRNDQVALYELLFDDACCGWEVARIFTQAEQILNGHTIQAAEVLPSNERFGTEGLRTKSQAFHMNSRKKAESYFSELSERLRNAKSVDTYEKLDTFSPQMYQSATLGVTGPTERDHIGHGKQELP